MRKFIITFVFAILTFSNSYIALGAILSDVADDLQAAGKSTISAVQDVNKAVTDPFAGEFSSVDSTSQQTTLIHPAVDPSLEQTKTGSDAFTASNYIYDGSLLDHKKENLMHAMVMTERDLLHGRMTFRPNYMILLKWNTYAYNDITSVTIYAWNTKVDVSADKLQTPEGRLYVYNQANAYVLSTPGLKTNDDCNTCDSYVINQEECMQNLYIWLELKTSDGRTILSNILNFNSINQ